MRTKQAIFWLCVLFVTAFTGGRVAASNRWQTWRFATPNISWYNGGTGDYYNIFQEEAVTDSDSWNSSSLVELFQTGSYGTNTTINGLNGYYGATGWIGLATIRSNTDCFINYGDAQLNQSYLDDGTYTRIAKKYVACQEIGHLFGLDHTGDTSSCMTSGAAAPDHPNSHDFDMLVGIYTYDQACHDQCDAAFEACLPNADQPTCARERYACTLGCDCR